MPARIPDSGFRIQARAGVLTGSDELARWRKLGVEDRPTVSEEVEGSQLRLEVPEHETSVHCAK